MTGWNAAAVLGTGITLVGAAVAWGRPRIRAMAARSRARAAEDAALVERWTDQRRAICALSADEARRRAERLLADPDVFECAPASGAELPDILAPSLRSLFSRFESVVAVRGEAVLDRRLIAPFGWEWEDGPWRRHRFWQVGRASGHGVTLVRPHEDGLFDVEEYEEGDDLDTPDFPSVYHWLLAVGSDIDGGDL